MDFVGAISRRTLSGAMALAMTAMLGGCHGRRTWHGAQISGTLPALSFTMTRANDGKVVTADNYRGKVVLLYFGYSFCPDVCPLTLSNAAHAITALGPQASQVKLLFVTVDPNRDQLSNLKTYAAAFGTQVDALRGDEDQLTALARRYRVAYSVDPGGQGKPYVVMHGSAIYAFDRRGRIRLLINSLSTDKPDIEGTAADLRALLR
jgi:protein SCO1/2